MLISIWYCSDGMVLNYRNVRIVQTPGMDAQSPPRNVIVANVMPSLKRQQRH